ncbi:MAG TPA: ComEC/Rec2 family competence protein [Anaerolineales bacterium]|nr:ComEC/Rec2 family competence protein [Anaerolineales bacterium]
MAGLFAAVFGRLLGPRRGAFAALVAISGYTVLVGGDAPVVRAAIMGGFSLFAGQVGRRQHGLNSLAISAGLMTLGNPYLLWDVGFQLSFMATLGLVVYAGPWGERMGDWLATWLPPEPARRVTGLVSEYFLLTLAAQLTTLPILAYHFRRLSFISLPANLAILPAQPPVMIVGGLAVMAGLAVPWLGQWAAYAVWPFLAYTIRAVAWFAGVGGNVVTLGWFHPLWVFVFYALLFGVTYFWETIKDKMATKRRKGRKRAGAALVVLGVLTVLVWQAALAAPDGLLRATFLDVGDGEALLVQTPEGRYMLVGGGDSAVQLSYGLGKRLPLFHRNLDVLVVAGTESEQIDALPEVAARFQPEQVWWAGEPGASRPGRELYAWVREAHISMERMQAGQVMNLGDGAQLEVITVSEGGAVLQLSWEGFRCLLPVGALPEDLTSPAVQRALAGATVLLVPGSGDVDRNPAGWMEGASLNAAVLSVNALNRYGLPDGEVLAALEGTLILRTDAHGWVEFTTDGERLWVAVEDQN